MPRYNLTVDGRTIDITAPDQQTAAQEAIKWAQANPRPAMNPLESAGMGALDAGTFGFADEIGGGLGYITGNGYEATRDKIRESMKRAGENTKSFMAGQILGGVASAAIPGIGAAGALESALGRVGAGMAVGAGQGALYGLGSGEDASSRLEGAGKGALLGGALGGVGAKVGQMAGGAGRVSVNAAPTRDTILNTAKQGFEATKNEIVPANQLQALSMRMQGVKNVERFDKDFHPESAFIDNKVSEYLQKAQKNGGSLDLGQVHRVRQMIDERMMTATGDDKRMLGKFKDAFDKTVTAKVPEFDAAIKQYSTVMDSDRILRLGYSRPDPVTKAVQPLTPEQLSKRLEKIVNDPQALGKYSPKEQELLKLAAGGGRLGDRLVWGLAGKATSHAARMAATIGAYSTAGGGMQGALAGQGAYQGVAALRRMVDARRMAKTQRLLTEAAAVRRNGGVAPVMPRGDVSNTALGFALAPVPALSGKPLELTIPGWMANQNIPNNQ